MAIRPTSWPVATTPPATPQTSQTGPAANARAAAQRAFFEALKSQGVEPQAATTTVDTQTAPRGGRAPDLTIQMPKEPPQKILRPGSIIDIRV